MIVTDKFPDKKWINKSVKTSLGEVKERLITSKDQKEMSDWKSSNINQKLVEG